MDSQSVPGGGRAADGVQQLKEQLAHLQSYKALAEYNLQQMGLSLDAARKQGWVSKRAEVRRKRAQKKKAAKDAKWAEVNRNRLWLREQRKKLGLPVNDPTPSPTEAAYRERVAEAKSSARTLRNRVRRASHQLLVAAAIGKQYREAAMASHSGHSVPSADRIVPLKSRRYDTRSDTSLTATEAMARSFRNWANREKSNRFRSRPHTPSTVVVSSRTTGPEDTPSGSDSDSSFTDDDMDADVKGAMALIYDTKFWGEDVSNESDDDASGLASLDFNDVSDDIKVAACAMLAAAESSKGDDEDWADMLAAQVLKFLHVSSPTPPASPELNLYADSETGDGDSTDSSGGVKTALHDFWTSQNLKRATNVNLNSTDETSEMTALPGLYEANHKIYKDGRGNRSSRKKLIQQQKLKKVLKTRNLRPGQFKATVDFVQKQQQHQEPALQLPTPAQTPSLRSGQSDTQRWSGRTPNKPAAPCQGVWDPTWWQVNTKDADDGIWAGKAAKYRQPTDKMETGFVTWDQQETQFPRLDTRLRLYDARRPKTMIFDPATVDTQVWDPLNRAIAEPRTGKRAPLALNAVTTHSLARWTASEFGTEYPLDPIQLPDNPATEDKKRPLPSMTFSPAKETSGERWKMAGQSRSPFRGWRKGKWGKKTAALGPSSLATPTKKTPAARTGQSTAVASIHYPLKSPGPQSISKALPTGLHDAVWSAQPQQPQVLAFGAIAGLRFPPPEGFHASGPPTPYPRISSVPETPTVALYERPATPSSEDAPSSADEARLGEDKQLAAFPEDILRSGGSEITNNNGKRTAPDDSSPEPSGAAKRRKTDSSKEEEEAEEAAAASEEDTLGLGFLGAGREDEEKDEEEELQTSSVRKSRADVVDSVDTRRSFWERRVHPTSWWKAKTYRRGGEKKSVRFDVRSDEDRSGPSAGMRDGARRALGRYDLTASRRGPLGPFR